MQEINVNIQAEIRDRLEGYDIDSVLQGYEVKNVLIDSIVIFLRNRPIEEKRLTGLAVMYYLLHESIAFHELVGEDDPDSGLYVIYGDYLGTLYHKAVIDFNEYEISEEIVSRYKQICIDIFENGHAVSGIMRD